MSGGTPLARGGSMGRGGGNEALRAIARDLRRFVSRLRQPRVGDRAWIVALRKRYRALRRRVEDLRRSDRTSTGALARLREALRQHRGAISAKRPRKLGLREMRASLARSYEDMVAHLRSRGDGRLTEGLRAIRLPRLARTLSHVLLGLGCVLLYEFVVTWGQAMLLLGVAFGSFATLEVTRKFSPAWNDFLVDKLFGAISRPRERYRINSATYYLSALVIITLVTPKVAVCAAVLVLALADPAAMIVGFNWGRRRIYEDKTLEGSVGFFVVAFLAVFVYLLLAAAELSFFACLGYALSVSVVGTLVELYSGKLDDNFTIPVACALFGMLWV